MTSKSLPIENDVELLKAVVEKLTQIEFTLRLKGDHYRAGRVRAFRREYFGDEK